MIFVQTGIIRECTKKVQCVMCFVVHSLKIVGIFVDEMLDAHRKGTA